jgi:hypothetical protein
MAAGKDSPIALLLVNLLDLKTRNTDCNFKLSLNEYFVNLHDSCEMKKEYFFLLMETPVFLTICRH